MNVPYTTLPLSFLQTVADQCGFLTQDEVELLAGPAFDGAFHAQTPGVRVQLRCSEVIAHVKQVVRRQEPIKRFQWGFKHQRHCGTLNALRRRWLCEPHRRSNQQ